MKIYISGGGSAELRWLEKATTEYKKVTGVSTDRHGRDYVHLLNPVDKGGVHSSTTWFLEPGEKKGGTAVVSNEIKFHGDVTRTIEIVTKIPARLRWSYTN